jgi:hypothetical protein
MRNKKPSQTNFRKMFKVTYDSPNTMDSNDVDRFWGEAQPDMRRWKDTVLLYPRQYWYVINKVDEPEELRFGVFHRVIKKGDSKATTFKKEWGITEVELHTDDQGLEYAKVFGFFFFFF